MRPVSITLQALVGELKSPAEDDAADFDASASTPKLPLASASVSAVASAALPGA
eukprot:CAMPEP_0180654134 /NCGR_PEP_ID=MMETSP1037_2-20121125/54509_1 /TAXON_ID=632150 /ORGANISM="Azadinium spinosum, Strain 3D9" /LENGTH=53 /DNA_ID=CAMNT_0022680335 /DNA_START=262 /DNA_END=423 /DNA_ORIENTATION=+